MASRRVRIALLTTGALLALGTIVFVLLFPTIARWAIRSKVLARVEAKLGRQVEVDDIDAGFHEVTLAGVRVRGESDASDAPLAKVARVRVTYDFWPLLRGDVRLGVMEVERPRLTVVRHADGTDNINDILERLRGKRDGDDTAAGDGSRRRGLLPRLARVWGGSVRVADEGRGIEVTVEDFDALATPGGPALVFLSGAEARTRLGPKASAKRVLVAADLSDVRGTALLAVGEGRADLWKKMSLTGIAGSVAPAGDSRAEIAFVGGYGGVEGTLWQARGWVDPLRKDGQLSLSADRFTLDRLAPILKGGPIQSPEETSIDTSLEIEMSRGDVLFRGRLEVTDLNIFDPWLAEKPVDDLSVQGTVAGRYTADQRRLDLEELAVNFRDIDLLVDAFAEMPGGLDLETGAVRTEPRAGLHVSVPSVSCQKALDALPRELVPALQGFRLKGRYTMDLRIEVDWSNLDELVLEGIDGTIGLRNCKILKAPDGVNAEKLLDEFEHTVPITEEELMTFVVGPSNPDYVPLPDVSPHVINAFLTTEDSGFFKHQGFIVREFRSALIKNLKAGYFKYGASSITMQTVKNVLLHRQKTVARKLQELFLTYYLEQTLGKERILEIYVNAVEFGPGIYGIGPAAQHYFGKHASQLNPVEAAFLSSMLPSPKTRYLQYCKGELTRWGGHKIQRILKHMRDRDRLTEDEYQEALNTPLVFHFREDHDPWKCRKMVEAILEATAPTLPARTQEQ